jgi:hypothetical protein
MLSLLFGLTYWFYRLLSKTGFGDWRKVAFTFLLVSIIFDMVVLVGLLKMELAMWGYAILPGYLIAFFQDTEGNLIGLHSRG